MDNKTKTKLTAIEADLQKMFEWWKVTRFESEDSAHEFAGILSKVRYQIDELKNSKEP